MIATKRIVPNTARLIPVFLLFFVLCSLLLAGDNKVGTGIVTPLIMPLRVFEEGNPQVSLEKDDFKLFINRQRREIIHLAKKEKSIGSPPALGRNFVLSFSMLSYNKEWEKGISFFITDVLRSDDSLVLLTPLKTYQLKVSANREGMIREIEEKLKKDCRGYFNSRMAEEKYLLGKIKNLFSAFRGSIGQTFFLTLINFLDTFPREFLLFKERFLLPSLERHRQALDLLRLREGERWWIHFQAFDMQALLLKVKDMIDVINEFITDNIWMNAGIRVAVKQKFNQLYSQLFSTGAFAEDRLLNTLAAGDIVYNVIFTSGAKKIETGNLNRISADLEGIYTRTALRSGGTAASVKTGNLEEGLTKVKDHVDHYFELAFAFDGRIEEKQFRVELRDKKKQPVLVYKNRYEKDELAELVRYLSQGKVRIVDFSREKSSICFSIESFRLKEPEKKGEVFGLLKVFVELEDSRGEKVYSSRNTLRATKERLDIKLPLPLRQGFEYDLSIKVDDLIANSAASFSRRVSLK